MGLKVNEKVGRYRDRMRAAGLRPVQIWVPDTRQLNFSRDLERQINLLQGKDEEKDALDFIESEGLAEHWE